MCDTLVRVTSDGVLFGKNSDRDANEAQVLEWVAAHDYEPGAHVVATHITLSQVARTNATILCRPWWMFGAEMGANEHGVVIGNEAVYTTVPAGEPALLGMDLVRLGLERANSASRAVDVMITLLEHHGQGGACSVERPTLRYDNSFLIADRREAYVLETAGSRWATERVTSGARSISNGLTIPAFADQYGRPVKSRAVSCARRQQRTSDAAQRARGPLDLFDALRDHGEGGAVHWSPLYGGLEAPCAHAGGLVTSSQTTGSLVADLRSDVRLWATGTSAPCTSVFKPVSVLEPITHVARATNQFDQDVPWWRHERWHRAVMRRGGEVPASFVQQRRQLESEAVESPVDSATFFQRVEALEQRCLASVANRPDTRPDYVRWRWDALDIACDLPRDDI